MGIFNKAATVIANSGYTSMGILGGIAGGAYGAMSDNTSVLGGALGGAALGMGLRAGAPAARRAYGKGIRGSAISKGFGFSGKRPSASSIFGDAVKGAKMRANQAIDFVKTGPKGASMKSNRGFGGAMSTGIGRSAIPNKSNFRQGPMSGMRTGSQGLNFSNPWTPTVGRGQIAV